jgi:hypothetical protein
MTFDEVLELARECRLSGVDYYEKGVYEAALFRFAGLIDAATRNECADKVVEIVNSDLKLSPTLHGLTKAFGKYIAAELRDME